MNYSAENNTSRRRPGGSDGQTDTAAVKGKRFYGIKLGSNAEDTIKENGANSGQPLQVAEIVYISIRYISQAGSKVFLLFIVEGCVSAVYGPLASQPVSPV